MVILQCKMSKYGFALTRWDLLPSGPKYVNLGTLIHPFSQVLGDRGEDHLAGFHPYKFRVS